MASTISKAIHFIINQNLLWFLFWHVERKTKDTGSLPNLRLMRQTGKKNDIVIFWQFINSFYRYSYLKLFLIIGKFYSVHGEYCIPHQSLIDWLIDPLILSKFFGSNDWYFSKYIVLNFTKEQQHKYRTENEELSLVSAWMGWTAVQWPHQWPPLWCLMKTYGPKEHLMWLPSPCLSSTILPALIPALIYSTPQGKQWLTLSSGVL